MSNSQVSVWGKLGILFLYFIRQSQTPAASFVGIRSRKVVIVVASRDLAARKRTEGNSLKKHLHASEDFLITCLNNYKTLTTIYSILVTEQYPHTLKEAKTVAIRFAITFKHVTPLWLFSSSPNSSSNALSLFVMKPCINMTRKHPKIEGIQ